MITSTVVLAMYNGEKYIIEQLNSILNQTHLPEYVIIADDGSTDHSCQLVKDFIVKNGLQDRWVCKKNDHNLGYADNFWYAANEVHTDVFLFCDQDDIWDPEKIETMVGVMEQNPQIMVLGSGYTAFTDRGTPYVDKALTKVSNTGVLEKLQLTNKTIFIGCEGCTMSVRTDFFKSLRDFHFDKAPHDEFVWKSALCVNGCYVLHKSLMKRRFHENNVTHNKMHKLSSRIRFLKLLLKSHESMLQYAEARGTSNRQKKIIQKNIDSVNLRIEQLEKRKLGNTLILATRYFNNYHSKKSLLMEFLIALQKG